MNKGRIIFISVVALLSIMLILVSIQQKGYEKVGRVNEYVLYYDQESDDGTFYGGFILKSGFVEISVIDAIQQQQLSDEYLQEIDELITDYNKQE